MTLTRRRFIATGSACAAGVAAVSLSPSHAVAANSLNLGSIELSTVSDGFLSLPTGFFFDPMPQQPLAEIIARYNLPTDILTPPCNVTLMRDGPRTVLFDVGSGPHFDPGAGRLVDTLAALDLNPDDITDIVFTHAHPDHLWGLLDDFDDPLFPNATYKIGRTEWAYWMDPQTVDTIGAERVAVAVGSQRRLAMIEDAITLFDDGDEILPGVAARATYGHTPGHMAFEIRSGTDAAMIVGDSIGNHHVAFERPDWPTGSDQNQAQAAITRVALLDQLAHEQTPLIGFHLTQGGIGRVERRDSTYRFVADL
ncbi:MBL fold metallo-hydrolase [Puniceibacterium sp. IMCC21224]|uniref:MBL fold metallo-hydrolase n=1 Tax=Puniceibacterium sp. IMCC21224 TaxID=1618204 RepID=UPI00064E1020|nr:MBL fold metallo-hydrolase [Puniceibacterium sp. IMCC21224]KMK66157.1 metallo-beta-lactamase superfamily enzyme [Puniceibacterium sp. IMCC21224]